MSFVNTSKVVKLPSPRNSIHHALRSESLKPEGRKLLEAQKPAEWADSRSSCTEVSNRQFGHSQYRLCVPGMARLPKVVNIIQQMGDLHGEVDRSR